MKNNDYKFGHFLCSLREEQGFTQADIAKLLDVTTAAVSKWENGASKPRVEKLFELANILGVSAEELVNGEKKQQGSEVKIKINPFPNMIERFERIFAQMLDYAIALLTTVFLHLLFEGIAQTGLFHLDKLDAKIYVFVMLAHFILVYILRDVMVNGRSVGKRVLGLAIIDLKSGKKPNFLKLIVRNLFYPIKYVDLFFVLISGRSIGDLVSGTVTLSFVVQKRVGNSKGSIDCRMLLENYMKEKSNFKKRNITTASIIGVTAVTLSVLIYAGCLNTSDLVLLEDENKIVYSTVNAGVTSAFSDAQAVITDSGDVYIRGSKHAYDENYYGVENLNQYVNRYNLGKENRFVRIYDGQDAVKVNLENGGTIITEDHKVWLFLNTGEAYKVPALFCEGYTDAKLWDERVYLLTEDGTLGYATVSNPENFVPIAKHVKKYEMDYLDGAIVLITEDNKLYFLDADSEFDESAYLLDNITDFDFLKYQLAYGGAPMLNYYVFSYIDLDSNAYMAAGAQSECNIDFAQAEKIGENVVSVVTYDFGTAMLTDSVIVKINGSDFNAFRPYEEKNRYQSISVCNEACGLLEGYKHGIVIKKLDGGYEYFGSNPDKSSRTAEKIIGS